MPQPLIGGLPPNLDLPAGYTIRVTALNPATGAVVAGVVATNVALYVRNIGGGSIAELAADPFLIATEA